MVGSDGWRAHVLFVGRVRKSERGERMIELSLPVPKFVQPTKKWKLVEFAEAFDELMVIRDKHGMTDADLAQWLDTMRLMVVK